MRTTIASASPAILLVFMLLGCPTWAKEEQPLKVISPDLIVESFEFGKFPEGKAPMDEVPNSKVKFFPTTVVKGRGFSYGYRLKLKTSRKQINWTHTVGSFARKKSDEATKGKEKLHDVENGVVYFNFPIVDGFKKGKYWIKGWIEGQELPVLSYTVK